MSTTALSLDMNAAERAVPKNEEHKRLSRWQKKVFIAHGLDNCFSFLPLVDHLNDITRANNQDAFPVRCLPCALGDFEVGTARDWLSSD